MLQEATMARPKKRAEKKAPVGHRTIGVRASAEWSEWLEKLAAHFRTTNAGIIDRALAEWAESNGFPEKPPER